jgi:ATP-dependent exoDNAse (exonuclease V) beta subunit
MSIDLLAKRNSHPRDAFISFDEGPHIYTVHGDTSFTSVTTWNHSHFPKFDATEIINNILKSSKMKDPNYKYYGKSKDDILKMWDDNRDNAAKSGTNTHYNIECYYNEMDVKDNSVEYKYFLNFAKDHPYLKAYRTEWCVYHEELKLSGSIDMLFKDENTGEFKIYDWKRSKGIEYENYYGKTALTPCISHMPDTNFWHYSLQLNVYRRILKEKYNIDVTTLALVVLHPDNYNENYEVIDVPLLDKDLDGLWEYRKTQLGVK